MINAYKQSSEFFKSKWSKEQNNINQIPNVMISLNSFSLFFHLVCVIFFFLHELNLNNSEERLSL